MARLADKYPANDVVPAEIEHRLLEHLDPMVLEPKTILDAGAGTGRTVKLLRGRYPSANVIALDLSTQMLRHARGRWPWRNRARVCGDHGALPIKTASVDLIVSNLGLGEGTMGDPERSLAEFARVLAPGGLLLFATLGPDSFKELAHAWLATDETVTLPPLVDMHDLGDALTRHGFAGVVVDAEKIQVTFPAIGDLFAELVSAGAVNLGPGRSRGLRGRDCRTRLAANYPRNAEGGFEVTLEVAYAHAWRAKPNDSHAVNFDL
jgi:malonyl-CoA O-methyltransferase